MIYFPNRPKQSPHEMEIKDELAAVDDIEYTEIDAFKNINSNTPGYYIVQWKGNAYTLKGKYTCHVFDPPVIIPEGGIVFQDKFMTPMRKNLYYYHDTDEAIPVMAKLKKFVMTYIELIQDNNKKNKFPSHFKGYANINPNSLSEHDHQMILDKI